MPAPGAIIPLRGQRLVLLLLAIAGLTYSGILLFKYAVSINLDGAMYMEAAQRLMQGAQPYIDFVDINPPLAYYLHIVPFLLSDISGTASTNTFLLLVYIATALSVASSYRLLTRYGQSAPAYAVLVCLTPALLLLPMEATRDLGQRPHLFCLAALPWLITRLLRYREQPPPIALSLGVGAVTAVTVCLKPFHYAFILASVELFLLYRYRNYKAVFGPEILISIVAAGAYGLSFLLLTDASRDAFFSFYVPLILEAYQAYNADPTKLFSKAGEHLTEPLILALASAALIRTSSNTLYRELCLLGSLFAICGAALYLWQAKGWPYHAISVWLGGYLAITCLAGWWTEVKPQGYVARFCGAMPAITLSTLVVVVLTYSLNDAASSGKKITRDYAAEVIARYSDAAEPIYVMSSSVDAAYPLLQLTGRRQATRFPFLFPLPMMYFDASSDPGSPYQHAIRPEKEALELQFLEMINNDLHETNPPLILIDRYKTCPFCPLNMTLPDYVDAKQTELSALTNYEQAGYTKRFDIRLRKDVLATKGPPE